MDDKLTDKLSDPENDNAAVREVDGRYRLLMELVADGIIIVQDGVIKEINPSMAKLSGYGPEPMMDTALTEYFPPDGNPAVDNLLDRPVNESGAPQVLEAALVCKNGQRLKVEIIAAGCTFGQNPAKLLVVRDISDRPTARESIEKAGKLDAIAALSGGIAHDYNNLLTAIIGNITLAQTHLKPKDKPSDDPGMTDYKQYGFSGVVAKPYTLEELGEKLSRVLKG